MNKKLSELVKINSGLIISREKTLNNNRNQYRVLNYKCINENGEINPKTLDILDLIKNIDDKFITKENDIIVKMVYPFKAILIGRQEKDLIITSNFCKITCLNEILPEYLVACLNSEKIDRVLKIESKNQTINQISIKDLEKVEIELHDIENQKRIANMYMNFLKRIQLTKTILEKEQRIIKNIYK